MIQDAGAQITPLNIAAVTMKKVGMMFEALLEWLPAPKGLVLAREYYCRKCTNHYSAFWFYLAGKKRIKKNYIRDQERRKAMISYQELCKNWEIEPDKYRDMFEWLKTDPRDEKGRLTREVGLRKKGGIPEKLERKHTEVGVLFYKIAENLMERTIFPKGIGAQVSAMDFYF